MEFGNAKIMKYLNNTAIKYQLKDFDYENGPKEIVKMLIKAGFELKSVILEEEHEMYERIISKAYSNVNDFLENKAAMWELNVYLIMISGRYKEIPISCQMGVGNNKGYLAIFVKNDKTDYLKNATDEMVRGH